MAGRPRPMADTLGTTSAAGRAAASTNNAAYGRSHRRR